MEMQELRELLLRNDPKLKFLGLLGADVGGEEAKALAEVLQHNTVLRALSLGGDGTRRQTAEALFDALRKDVALKELMLWGCSLGDQTVQMVAEALTQNNNLTSLSLNGNAIGDGAVCALAPTLRQNSTLRALSLAGNSIGDDGALALAASIREGSALERLFLAGNDISARGAEALGQAAAAEGSVLAELNLARNAIGEEGAIALAQVLLDKCTLKELNLDGNGIGEQGSVKLAAALRRNGSLEVLSLEGNGIGDTGTKSLARALEHNSTLKTLSLAGNGIGHSGAAALAAALRHNASLTVLNLQRNNIGDAGAMDLANTPRRISATMTLNICWNNIIESALREIEELSQRSVNVIREHEEPVQNSIFAELQLQEPPIAVGSAKTVHRAKWHCDDVAVLTVHGGGSDYVQPAELQSLSEHPGLTRVRHICKSPEGNVVIVTEFAPMGSLDKVLRDLRGEKGRTISNQTLVQCAIQVCAGMERLVEECLLHKNLSLHNVLVFDFHPDDPQRVRVKVADYWFEGGSAYSLGELALPFRWMAPESLTRRRWSEMSIVWSFGVLMWEMWSEEAAPYSSLSSAEEVASLIGRGDRLPKPEGCPEDIYGLMQLCWERSPARRPGFRQLSEDLRRMSGEIPA